MTLTRRTALTRSGPIARSGSIARARRSSVPASEPRRIWTAAREKVKREGLCRVCGACGPDPGPGVRLEAAHIIGREHDPPLRNPAKGYEDCLWVDPRDIVPLCTTCHADYDARRIDLLPHLTTTEQSAAVRHVGIVAALRRLTSSRKDPS